MRGFLAFPSTQFNPIREASMPKHLTSILALFVSLAALSAASAIAADGPIVITQAKANAGNVTPGDTPGFPVKLSRPGSYVFASNLQPPAGKAGINIASSGVTIDMNGFRLRGVGGATTGIYGAAFENVTIRNGAITGFADHGIYGTGNNWTVEDMQVVKNGVYGIVVYGSYSSVRSSTVMENAGFGIVCTLSCLVAESIVSANGAEGIFLYSGTVLGNVIIDNTGFGIQGVNQTGYGNNTLAQNNGGVANPQTIGVTALHPNACDPACP
jgi:hypothetical protein